MITTSIAARASYDTFSLEEGDHRDVPLAVRVTMRASGRRAGAARIVFLVDRSSSMSWAAGSAWPDADNRYEAVTDSLDELGGSLGEDDEVALFTFNHETQDMSSGFVTGPAFRELLKQLPAPSGGTYFPLAFWTTYQLLHGAGDSDLPLAVVLLSDGDTVDPETSYVQLERLTTLGIDFVPLAYGSTWQTEVFNRLAGICGQSNVEAIETAPRAREIFESFVRRQRASVVCGARMVATLNTQHFAWNAVRSLQPSQTGRQPVKIVKDTTLDGHEAGIAKLAMGNLADDKIRSFVFEARPVPGLPLGRYPIAEYYAVDSKGTRITEDTRLELTVVEKTASPRDATPQNAILEIHRSWMETLIPDQRQAVEVASRAKDLEGKRRQWKALIKLLHETNKLEEASFEQASLEAWARGEEIDPAKIKAAESRQSKTASQTATSTNRDVENAPTYTVGVATEAQGPSADEKREKLRKAMMARKTQGGRRRGRD